MNQTDALNVQGLLAMAAYADATMPFADAVKAIGMTNTQANAFVASWSVVDQYTDPATGLSATVFEEIATGKKYIAIRGTEPTGTDLTADGLLALGLPSNLNPQFTALKAQIDAWLANGTLGDAFTITGHSLGGYLAAAVKQAYPEATDAYLFNAPGVGGPLGNLADAITSALGLSGAPASNIWNVRGSEGFPIISGLGYQLGMGISIQTEAAANPLDNHSIVTLTDALAIQSLYSRLAPGLSPGQLNTLVDASGTTMSQTLESALDALRTLLLGPATGQTPTGDRDTFYANLHMLQGSTAYTALMGSVQLTLLTALSASDIATQAKGNDAQGLATRYALVALNPFVLSGADYNAFNTQGELNLYDPATGTGNLTEQYLTDRAAMLERKLHFNEYDEPSDTSGTFSTDSYRDHHPNYFFDERIFEDKASGYRIQQGDISGKTSYVIFGSNLAETGDSAIKGGDNTDHLYGGGGDDTLIGGKDNDYLEGGTGADTYQFTSGDGYDTVLDTDGLGVIKLGDIQAKGSAGLDQKKWKKFGADLFIDTQNNITYSKSVANGETRLLIHKGDSNVVVKGRPTNEAIWKEAA